MRKWLDFLTTKLLLSWVMGECWSFGEVEVLERSMV